MVKKRLPRKKPRARMVKKHLPRRKPRPLTANQLPNPQKPSPLRPRALTANLPANPQKPSLLKPRELTASRPASQRRPRAPLRALTVNRPASQRMANLLENRARRALGNLPRAARTRRDRKDLNPNPDQRTRRDPRARTNGGCATARRSWRRPNATVCTTRPTPGRRLSARPYRWATSAVSARTSSSRWARATAKAASPNLDR